MSLNLLTLLPSAPAAGRRLSHLLRRPWLTLHDLTPLSLAERGERLFSCRADALLIVLDARQGADEYSRWIGALACMSHIAHVLVAIDNITRVEAPRELCQRIADAFTDPAVFADCRDIEIIPIDVERDVNIDTGSKRPEGVDARPLLVRLKELASVRAQSRQDPAGAVRSDHLATYLCWLDETPLLPSRRYLFDNGAQQTEATVSHLKYRLNPRTLDRQAANRLHRGEVGYGNLSLRQAIDFPRGLTERADRMFWLRNPENGEKVAVGVIRHSLRRSTNVRWQHLDIDKRARAALKRQRPFVVWFTGLSGSGKSTLASLLEKRLHAMGYHTYLMDGDNVRHGLCRDLGFTEVDRVENIRRVAEVAKLMVDAGLIVITSFISPFRAERRMARELMDEGEFVEVFVDTPLEICERRDVKGLYKKARAGQIRNFTGIDSPYELPRNAEIHLDAANEAPQILVDGILRRLREMGLLPENGRKPSND